jgi:hypothetical protein
MIFKDLDVKIVDFTNYLSLMIKLFELLYNNYLLCAHSLLDYNLIYL